MPRGVLRWKVSKAGVGEIEAAPLPLDTLKFDLTAAAAAPSGMVYVPAGTAGDFLAVLGRVGPYTLPPFFADKFEVTNRQFQEFVDRGGYTNQAFWKEPITREGRELGWTEAMRLFLDTTGRPGPSTWEGGHYPDGKGDNPVAGVSWYEAAAYARWLGKRLPTDAEWVKAASSPIVLPGGELRQRRYPWGDIADGSRANLWGSGPQHTTPVDANASGDTSNGIRQLIGNVWEWTAADLDVRAWERLWPDGSLHITALKALRGGAFDTYFDVQATCQFQ
ncbi:MAG: formylglycine-generating enzyme family protein, partial [Bradyrhizobium sp.]